MSVQTLYTAATGMEALETKLDVIANNLANVSTVGFKKDRANFEDLFYRQDVIPGGTNNGEPTGVGTQIGLGARVSSVQANLQQGAFQQTGRQLDIAIEGNGFLTVTDGSGQNYYTRAGNLSINRDGELVLGSANIGRRIEPPIAIDPEARQVQILEDGTVEYFLPDNTTVSAGNLTLTSFPNPEALTKAGDNLYLENEASGAAVEGGQPGTTGLGWIRQGVLEASNVEPVQELIDLIQTQRNFELNSQAVQAGDQIMQLISNLRR